MITIEFSDEYSSDKSKIKEIFRQEPFSDGIELVNDAGDTSPTPSFARGVRTIFEDASVRLAQGPSGPNAVDLYQSFASGVDWHFQVYAHMHTYVMAFDDKRHVPARKRSAQRSRRETLAESMRRRQIPEWEWDGQSVIMDLVGDRPLPPWERVRADAAAYLRIIEELAAHLERMYSPPAGRRLIIDYGRRVSVLETSLDGRVLAPRIILADKPDIGEGDMAALYYARHARHACYERTGTLPEGVDAHERRPDADPRLLLSYYGEDTSPLEPDQRMLPRDLRTDMPSIPVALVRRHYEAGDIVLRSVDTDFLTLSLACLASSTDEAYAHNIFVALGRAHRSATASNKRRKTDGPEAIAMSAEVKERYCTGTAPGAIVYQEYYDMRCIYQRLCTTHSAPERCPETAWSFVAFCISCGNDYTRRLHNLSHRTMYEGYKRAFARNSGRLVSGFARASEVPDVALLNVAAFVELVRHAYYERLPESRRPSHGAVPGWHELREIVQQAFPKNERAHMPTIEALTRYHNQVAWSLAYASGASYGREHLP